MPFIEAPTTFYMGRRYDPSTKRLVDEVVYYDSRDLTTHAVVVGMTGSGKTGLCISLLEEAVLDNIPAIVIDPKGDITNLLLAFPNLRPEDFAPWVNVDDARRAGLDLIEFSRDVAQQWRDGLASWSIVPQRIAAMKNVCVGIRRGEESGAHCEFLQKRLGACESAGISVVNGDIDAVLRNLTPPLHEIETFPRAECVEPVRGKICKLPLERFNRNGVIPIVPFAPGEFFRGDKPVVQEAENSGADRLVKVVPGI